MPSLKDLKNRIKSVKSTQKITKAMKMVAAAKLRRAREAAENARPYATALETMLQDLAVAYGSAGGAPPLLAGTGKQERHLVIIATSDRGLCGAFNGSIVRSARKRLREMLAEGKQLQLIFIGRKGFEFLAGEFGAYTLEQITDVSRRRIAYTEAEAIANRIIQRFDAGEFDVAHIVYNRFKSAISQLVTWQQLIPLERKEKTAEQYDMVKDVLHPEGPKAPYEYEPSEEAVLKELLPRNVAVQIYRGLLENAASEQGARMTAMDNATRNAGEMIKRLTLQYNRSRQAAITKELIEIISGAEAV